MSWFRNTIPYITHIEGAVSDWKPTTLIKKSEKSALRMRYTPALHENSAHYVDFFYGEWLITGRDESFYLNLMSQYMYRDARILEIGPGLGALSSILVNRQLTSMFIDPVNYNDLGELISKTHTYAQSHFPQFIIDPYFAQNEAKLKAEQLRFSSKLIEFNRRCDLNSSIIAGKHKRACFINRKLEEVYSEVEKFQPDVIISAYAHDHWNQGLGWITNLQRYARGARLITPTSNRIL